MQFVSVSRVVRSAVPILVWMNSCDIMAMMTLSLFQRMIRQQYLPTVRDISSPMDPSNYAIHAQGPVIMDNSLGNPCGLLALVCLPWDSLLVI